MEVPRLGGELELQLLAHTTATANARSEPHLWKVTQCLFYQRKSWLLHFALVSTERDSCNPLLFPSSPSNNLFQISQPRRRCALT